MSDVMPDKTTIDIGGGAVLRFHRMVWVRWCRAAAFVMEAASGR